MRCLMDETTPCVFRHTLLRIIHSVLIHLHRWFPASKLFLQKVNFKSTSRRMHLSIYMAKKCITVVGNLAFLSLRLTFGGRPCPSLWWSDFSETITDLSNALASDNLWDPTRLHSPLQHLKPQPYQSRKRFRSPMPRPCRRTSPTQMESSRLMVLLARSVDPDLKACNQRHHDEAYRLRVRI
jgi:hypothetical protein